MWQYEFKTNEESLEHRELGEIAFFNFLQLPVYKVKTWELDLIFICEHV